MLHQFRTTAARNAQRSLFYEPDRPDPQELVVFFSTGSSSSSRGLDLSWPTNMLIITPPFFYPFILDAPRQHFTSFSTVYMCTSSPTSTSPTTSPTLGPGSPNGPKQLEDSLYSWGPLRPLKHVTVVFYNPDNAERACQASDRYASRQQHPHPKSPCVFSVVRIQH